MTFPSRPLPTTAERRGRQIGWINAGCGALVAALLVAGVATQHAPAPRPQVVAIVVADAGASHGDFHDELARAPYSRY